MLKLLGSLGSPFARKIRVVLLEKEIDFQLEQVDIWKGPPISHINPIGKIPCLVTGEGEAVFDSRVIVQYLEMNYPAIPLVPVDVSQRTDVLVVEALADGLLDALTSIRMEMTFAGRPDAHRNPQWMDRQMSKAQAILADMERRIGARPSCARNRPTLADLCIGVGLGYLDFRFAQLRWREAYPNLARLSGILETRASFQETLPPVA